MKTFIVFLIVILVSKNSVANDMNSKMSKFQLNKLVRDKIPAHHDRNGSITHLKPLTDAEFDAALRTKLLEEIQEIVQAQSKEELAGEIADLFEVIDALSALHGISIDEIKMLQEKKRTERGGFYGRTFVTVTEHPVGSQGENYCRAQPEKYVEVK